MTTKSGLMVAGAVVTMLYLSPVAAQDLVGLITKTDTNPFWVKMREGASAKAKELGLRFQSYAGKHGTDNDSQVAAVEALIAAGAKGFAIAPSDSAAIVPAIAKARKAGLFVIALNTPLDPANAADATFATNNFRAGELTGQWAKGALGKDAANAKVAFLNLSTSQQLVEVLRNQGFMKGFGIDIQDAKRIGDETDRRIVGHQKTGANEEGGRTAMETLLQKDPGINVVFTYNEPAAAGAWQALKAAGRQGKVLVVSVDGGCPGVKDVKDGVIGATAQQYPLKMAAMAMEAIALYLKTGKKPVNTPGLEFVDTGVSLVTNKLVPGVPSIGVEEGLKLCWG